MPSVTVDPVLAADCADALRERYDWPDDFVDVHGIAETVLRRAAERGRVIPPNLKGLA